jgi:hypothetical protein
MLHHREEVEGGWEEVIGFLVYVWVGRGGNLKRRCVGGCPLDRPHLHGRTRSWNGCNLLFGAQLWDHSMMSIDVDAT